MLLAHLIVSYSAVYLLEQRKFNGLQLGLMRLLKKLLNNSDENLKY